MSEDFTKRFYQAIIDEDLMRIDKYIQKGLLINQTYYSYYGIYDGKKYFTPLICAIENQSVTVVEHLLKRGAVALIKSDDGKIPLSTAAKNGNLRIVKLLVENDAKPSMQAALLVAIENRRLDIVQYMVEKGVFINWNYKNGDTPLSKAITYKCEKIAIFLIDNGASIEKPGINNRTPLVLAIQNQTLDISKYLIQKGARINQIDRHTMQEAFFDAIEKTNLEFVKYLVEQGANVNWKSYNDDTPLGKSITTDKCGEIAKFLIDNGANLDEVDSRYRTPLVLSVEKQKFDIMTYLLQKGANVNYKQLFGPTALSVAASKRYFSFATYLIKFGADINLAQKAVDEYAREDEDFDIFLKLFQMGHLKLNNSVDKKSLLLEKELGSGQEAAPLPK